MSSQSRGLPNRALGRYGSAVWSVAIFSSATTSIGWRCSGFSIATWVFLAHETEIAKPGDFVSRTMGQAPVVVVRDNDGSVTAC